MTLVLITFIRDQLTAVFSVAVNTSVYAADTIVLFMIDVAVLQVARLGSRCIMHLIILSFVIILVCCLLKICLGHGIFILELNLIKKSIVFHLT